MSHILIPCNLPYIARPDSMACLIRHTDVSMTDQCEGQYIKTLGEVNSHSYRTCRLIHCWVSWIWQEKDETLTLDPVKMNRLAVGSVLQHSHKILMMQQGKLCYLGIWCHSCLDQERCQAGRASLLSKFYESESRYLLSQTVSNRNGFIGIA